MNFQADLGFDTLTFSCDLEQASSPIMYEAHGDWHSTPYQVADARHDDDWALRLVVEYLGRDYYASPDDERDDEAILDELLESVEVRRVPDEDDEQEWEVGQ